MKTLKCSVCKCNLSLRLMPDYGSAGLWCGVCGVGFMNPKKSYPFVPEVIFNLIEGWNALWDLSEDNMHINKSYFEKLLNSTGLGLAELLNEYIPAYYDDTIPIFYR
jgi:hypothetical protein